MARRASVRYWQSRQAFCCTQNGRQIVLCEGVDDSPSGPNYNAAVKKFAELVTGKPKGQTLAEVIASYLSWIVHHRQADTVKSSKDRLKRVSDELGQKVVSELTAFVVEAWADEKRHSRGWGDGTVRLTLACLNACLNWAVRSGVIPSNPINRVEMPSAVSRGLECVLTDQQAELVINTAKDATREFVQCLRDTGCRPAELRRAEASNYDPALNALVYQATGRRNDKRHKTARTGKARVVFLSGAATEIVRRLVEKHPTGPLFRTAHAKMTGADKGKRGAWTSASVVEAFGRLRRKTGIRGLSAMSFRHTYAVRWLNSGKAVHSLAAVLGTSVLMIQRHYGHHAQMHDVLRKLVDS